MKQKAKTYSKEQKKENRKKFLSLYDLFPTEFSNLLSHTLMCFDIAEKEIENYQLEYPRHSGELFDAFRFLMPSPLFRKISKRVFRNHCRELLERIVLGKSTKLATKAEVLLSLSESSLDAPLRQNYAYLYYRLFKHIFGKKRTENMGIKKVGQELYKGEYKKLFKELQKKLRQDWRK